MNQGYGAMRLNVLLRMICHPRARYVRLPSFCIVATIAHEQSAQPEVSSQNGRRTLKDFDRKVDGLKQTIAPVTKLRSQCLKPVRKRLNAALSSSVARLNLAVDLRNVLPRAASLQETLRIEGKTAAKRPAKTGLDTLYVGACGVCCLWKLGACSTLTSKLAPNMPHPWIWLNEPQHSSAVSAITSALATTATVVAAWFAYGAYRTASQQIALAKEEAELAKLQAEKTRVRLAVEDAGRTRERWAEVRRRVAEEEALRPAIGAIRVQTTRHNDVEQIRTVNTVSFENTGATEATSLIVHDGQKQIAAERVLRPGSRIAFSTELGAIDDGLIVRFVTRFGSYWTFRIRGSDPLYDITLISVSRPYDFFRQENEEGVNMNFDQN
jgi:hypothetical protein